MDSITLLSYGIAVLVPLMALYLIRAFDLYGTGQFSTILLSFGWGLLGAFGTAYLINTAAGRAIGYSSVTNFTAPLLEELLKALVLIYLIFQPRFRYPVDGAIYGFAVGIGFAMSENLFVYLGRSTGSVVLVGAISRVLSATLMHATASALVGYALGQVRRTEAQAGRLRWGAVGVGSAVVVHMLYNNLVSRGILQGAALLLVAIVWGVGGGAFIAYLARRGILQETRAFDRVMGQRSAEGFAAGVSDGERDALQRFAVESTEDLFVALDENFDDEKRELILKLWSKQANIGILRGNLSVPVSDRLRRAWEEEIARLEGEVQEIRKQLGEDVEGFVERLFPAENDVLREALHEELGERDPTLVHSFDLFMRLSEMAQPFTPEQLQRMASMLKRAEIFQHVSLEHLENLSRALLERTLAAGETLFRKNDPGEYMYLVRSGSIDIFVETLAGEEVWLRTFEEGGVVGEFALLDGRPRSASARAGAGTQVLELRRSLFSRFIASRPDVIFAMLKYLAGKLRYTTAAVEKARDQGATSRAEEYAASEISRGTTALLSDTANIVDALIQSERSIFRRMSPEDLRALVDRMGRRTFKQGAVLFHQGDPGDALYVVLSGRVRIYLVDAGGERKDFRDYLPYQTVGEIALLDDEPRSASASAEPDPAAPGAPIELLVLHRDDFRSFLRERPIVGLDMMRDLTDRVRYTTSFLERNM